MHSPIWRRNNASTLWSTTTTREVIGYQPEEDSELRFADDMARVVTQGGQGWHSWILMEHFDVPDKQNGRSPTLQCLHDGGRQGSGWHRPYREIRID